MKKVIKFSTAVVAISMLFSLVALPAYAQPTEQCTVVREIRGFRGFVIEQGAVIQEGTTKIAADALAGVTTPTSDWGTICTINTINQAVDWIFLFLLVVAVALIAIAGFLWMTSGGSPDRQGQAGAMIMAAVIGIAIAIFARLIPALVTGFLL